MMNIPWGNVFIILVLGALFIIISYLISRKVSTLDSYISGKGTLGVAFGTTSLLAFWITGNTIMAGPEAVYTNGYLGMIAYAMAGVGLFAFMPMAQRIHKIIPNGRTIGDFVRNRFDKKTYNLFIVGIFIWVFGLLMTQGIGGGLLLEQTFDVPYKLAVTLTFIIVIIYSTLGGFSSITGLAFFQVMLILFVIIIVPPIVYFSTGTSAVYNGLFEVAPDALNIIEPSGLLMLFAFLPMMAGEIFMDNTFWQRAYAIRPDKIKQVFSLSGIGWIFIPSSVAALAFVSLAFQQAPEQVNQVAPFIAEVYGGPFAKWAFLVGVWSALTSTIAAVINALVSLITNDIYLKVKPKSTEKQQLRFSKRASISVGILGLLVSLPQLNTMLGLLVFLGVVNAAFLFPIIYGLFWKKLNTNVTFGAVIAAISIGYFVYFTIGDLQGIVVSGWISFLGCWIGSLIKPANFDWDILRRVGMQKEGKSK